MRRARGCAGWRSRETGFRSVRTSRAPRGGPPGRAGRTPRGRGREGPSESTAPSPRVLGARPRGGLVDRLLRGRRSTTERESPGHEAGDIVLRDTPVRRPSISAPRRSVPPGDRRRWSASRRSRPKSSRTSSPRRPRPSPRDCSGRAAPRQVEVEARGDKGPPRALRRF